MRVSTNLTVETTQSIHTMLHHKLLWGSINVPTYVLMMAFDWERLSDNNLENLPHLTVYGEYQLWIWLWMKQTSA